MNEKQFYLSAQLQNGGDFKKIKNITQKASFKRWELSRLRTQEWKEAHLLCGGSALWDKDIDGRLEETQRSITAPEERGQKQHTRFRMSSTQETGCCKSSDILYRLMLLYDHMWFYRCFLYNYPNPQVKVNTCIGMFSSSTLQLPAGLSLSRSLSCRTSERGTDRMEKSTVTRLVARFTDGTRPSAFKGRGGTLTECRLVNCWEVSVQLEGLWELLRPASASKETNVR